MHNLKVLHTLICPFTNARKICKYSPLHGNEGKETEGQRCAAVNMYKDLMYHHTLKFPDQHQKKSTVQKPVRIHAFPSCLFLYVRKINTRWGSKCLR